MTDRVLVLQHDLPAPAASFEDWATAREYAVDVLLAEDGWPLPDLKSVAFVASLGSDHASYNDELPWLERELRLLARAHAADVPIFGICFGAQTLARSLGARTGRADAPEIGWYEVDSADPSAVPRGPWLFWHEDVFELPPGAQLLARTAAGPAAFRAGKCVGVQFHPEVTAEIVDDWIDQLADDLSSAVQEDLRRGAQAEPDLARDRAWQLYDYFLAGMSRPGAVAGGAQARIRNRQQNRGEHRSSG